MFFKLLVYIGNTLTSLLEYDCLDFNFPKTNTVCFDEIPNIRFSMNVELGMFPE